MLCPVIWIWKKKRNNTPLTQYSWNYTYLLFFSSDNIGTKQHVVLCINFHFLPSPLCMLVAYPMGAGTYLVIETFQLNGKRMKRSWVLEGVAMLLLWHVATANALTILSLTYLWMLRRGLEYIQIACNEDYFNVLKWCNLGRDCTSMWWNNTTMHKKWAI